jgi:nucleoside-diphosphate-sugar epimerase
MGRDTAATTFVTAADGFIGTELVKVLTAGGHQVLGLADSIGAADRLRRIGATAVMGDLLVPGQWQDEAAADWVFHLPPNPYRSRINRKHAVSIAGARVLMDANLLDAVADGHTRRIVYVGDTSCYGATGRRPITEDETLRPAGSGACMKPALDRVEGYVIAGLPIVTALPGWVYGNGSWFRERVIDPIVAGRRVLDFGDASPWVSHIHVRDCARALVHLAEHGSAGGRYFVVNSDPVRMDEFAATFSRLSNRALRVWRVPAITPPAAIARLLPGYPQTDAVFSNVRLRGLGFRFLYPTLEEGLQQVVDALG